MQHTKACNVAPLDEDTLQAELLVRLDAMREYIAKRIPAPLRSDIEPEDVLQEVWIAAFASRLSYRPTRPDALDRWLTGIVNHKLVDFLKTAAALKRGGHGRHRPPTHVRRRSLRGVFTRLLSPRRTPSGECRRREARHAVEVALVHLPADRQTALRMRYVDGESREEIARRMQKSEAAVSRLVLQGLQDLRRHLGSAARYLSDAGLSEGAGN